MLAAMLVKQFRGRALTETWDATKRVLLPLAGGEMTVPSGIPPGVLSMSVRSRVSSANGRLKNAPTLTIPESSRRMFTVGGHTDARHAQVAFGGVGGIAVGEFGDPGLGAELR